MCRNTMFENHCPMDLNVKAHMKRLQASNFDVLTSGSTIYDVKKFCSLLTPTTLPSHLGRGAQLNTHDVPKNVIAY